MTDRALWFDNPRTDPAWNLASEEHLLSAYDGTIAMLWRNNRSVIIGRNQDLHAEVDMDFAREHSIDVVRRLTGGGAVFHDLGNVNYTFITPHDGGRSANFAAFARPVIDALARMGVTAELSGRNDLLVDGRKISGCAHTLHNGRALYHGTLLFSANLSSMSGVLRFNEQNYKSKGIASVASRVGNLSEWLDTPEHPMHVEQFMATLRELLLAQGMFVPHTFTPNDIAAIDNFRQTKYANLTWTDGGWRGATRQKQVRTLGGSVEAWLVVREGRIDRARLTGDFFGIAPVSEVEALLTGLPYSRERVADVLTDDLLERTMHGVPQASLIEALFNDA